MSRKIRRSKWIVSRITCAVQIPKILTICFAIVLASCHVSSEETTSTVEINVSIDEGNGVSASTSLACGKLQSRWVFPT
ncbi:hypothetical protein Poly41_16830 [Novipirellula artificiosorum]|uniref:Secreted protein n=1 Tax=Novipirellula artificiosorum TaxID=2528016 RepID=A0A5C6DW09_9BACT|nr:hypothetical protein Poly41_16830 [Novipirellula artificiosorum]